MRSVGLTCAYCQAAVERSRRFDYRSCVLRRLSLALVVVLGACGTARVVWRTQTGGGIELQGDRSRSMEAANGEMSAHCGANNYTIVAEGLEPVGTDRYYSQNSSPYPQGGTQTNGYESQRTATIWRVHYQCNNAYAPNGMPAAAPGQPMPQDPPPPPPPAPSY